MAAIAWDPLGCGGLREAVYNNINIINNDNNNNNNENNTNNHTTVFF